MVRVAQLIKTMLEARQVAEAADRDYAFAEEEESRATILALWAALSGYHASVFKLRQTIKAQGDSLGPLETERPVAARWRWPPPLQVKCSSFRVLNRSLDGLGHILLRCSNDALELLLDGLGF